MDTKTKWGLRLLAAAFLVLSFWMGYHVNATGMLFGALLASVCLLLSSPVALMSVLDRFKSGKIGGLELVLNDKIKEADELIVRLNHLSVALVRPMYSVIARYGRAGTDIPRPMRVNMISELDAALRAAGKSESEIEEAKEEIHFFNMVDIVFRLMRKLSGALQTLGDEKFAPVHEMGGKIPDEKRGKVEELRKAAQDAWDLKGSLAQRINRKPYTDMPGRLTAAINGVLTFSNFHARG